MQYNIAFCRIIRTDLNIQIAYQAIAQSRREKFDYTNVTVTVREASWIYYVMPYEVICEIHLRFISKKKEIHLKYGIEE